MVKDSIMKIKKSKSKAEFHELSSKKCINGETSVEQTPTNGNKIEDNKLKMHKKHKKEKRKLNESNQLPKTEKTISINDKATLTNVSPSNAERQDLLENKDVVNIQKQESSRSSTKDTLMDRLRSASTHINSVMSLIHIPKHKNAGGDDSEDDEG